MALRTLFWAPDAVTHAAHTADLLQPWLEVHPVTLMCRCPCEKCARVTTTEECDPYQGICTIDIGSTARWQLVPTTRMGSCPNSNRSLDFSEACALGFHQTFSIVAVLADAGGGAARWRFHAWDCTRTEEALFFDPLKLEVFMAVFLAVGPTKEKCVDRMARLFHDTQQSGFQRADIRFRPPTGDLLPMGDIVLSLKPMTRWREENADVLRGDAVGSRKSPRKELASKPASKPAAKPAAAPAGASPGKRGRPNAQPANGRGRGEGAKRSKKEAPPERPAAKSPAPAPTPAATSPAAVPTPAAPAAAAGEEAGEEEEEDEDTESSLPAGWARAHDTEGTEYFFHITTLETQWERPQ
eukprot:EG_transcript_9189